MILFVRLLHFMPTDKGKDIEELMNNFGQLNRLNEQQFRWLGPTKGLYFSACIGYYAC
jgi:hypothetical protein